MLPSAPSFASTMLATTSPATKLMLDASGRGSPDGHTARKPASVGLTTVTFSTAAVAERGTPALPATATVMVEAAPNRPGAAPRPLRVSHSRVGSSGVSKLDGVDGASTSEVKYPVTSTMMSTSPVSLYTLTLPSAATGRTVAFDLARPGPTLIVEVAGADVAGRAENVR